MLKSIVNLPFRVLGRAARAFQDRQDSVMKEAHGDGTSGDDWENLENVPEWDTPDDFARSGTALAVDAAARRLDREDPLQFIDLRKPDAFARGALPGADNLPLATLSIRLAELPPATVRVVVYGPQAADAARFLRWRGFEDAWHLSGGIEAWRAAGHPAPPKGG